MAVIIVILVTSDLKGNTDKPLPTFLISPPTPEPDISHPPPYVPNIDKETAQKNILTKAPKPKFNKKFLRPRLAAVKIKPRTEEYKKLHKEQQEKKEAERLEKKTERRVRREERSKFGEAVTEQDYLRRCWEKECERDLKERTTEQREYIEKMKTK
ncbi:MAG: hypothetical protein Q9209_006456 [Squamulea sp. 1 TL-2023]